MSGVNPYLSLQVVDTIGIVSFYNVSQTPWNAFFAEFGGAAEFALPTRPPRLPATLHRIGHGLDLEFDSSAGSIGELDVRLPDPARDVRSRRSAQLPALPLRRHASLDAVQRDRAAVRAQPPRPGEPDHQVGLP